MARKQYSLYLAIDGTSNFDELLSDNALLKVQRGNSAKAYSAELGEEGVLYSFSGFRNKPDWVKQVETVFPPQDELRTETPAAVIFFKIEGKIFAITYSFGHSLLKKSKFHTDFGLKVAINFIHDEKLKSVERSNIGAAIRDLAQSAGYKDLNSFGVDDALDMIRKVTGFSKDSDFAHHVTGSRALNFSKDIELKKFQQPLCKLLTFINLMRIRVPDLKLLTFCHQS